MARYIAVIDSLLPAPEVWARMADVTRFGQWDPGVRSATQVAGSGPGPDASYVVTVGGLWGPLELRYDVAELDPPRRMVVVADTGVLRSEDEIVVVERAGGSRLYYHAQLGLHGPARILSPVMPLVLRLVSVRAARGLRRFLR